MEKNFGLTVRKLREEQNLLLRELSAKLEIDASLLSKIETGNRVANKELVRKIANVFNTEYQELLVVWLSDKIVNELRDFEDVDKILKIAKQRIQNGRK